MLSFPPSVRIFLATTPVDMRRQIDGLAALVADILAQDCYTGHVFVFRGRRPDRVKVLVWCRNGFVLLYKRLEKGKFRFPDPTTTNQELDGTALTLLLDGLDWEIVARAPRWHPRVEGSRPTTNPSSAS